MEKSKSRTARPSAVLFIYARYNVLLFLIARCVIALTMINGIYKWYALYQILVRGSLKV